MGRPVPPGIALGRIPPSGSAPCGRGVHGRQLAAVVLSVGLGVARGAWLAEQNHLFLLPA
jgi:hypothetical protein